MRDRHPLHCLLRPGPDSSHLPVYPPAYRSLHLRCWAVRPHRRCRDPTRTREGPRAGIRQTTCERGSGWIRCGTAKAWRERCIRTHHTTTKTRTATTLRLLQVSQEEAPTAPPSLHLSRDELQESLPVFHLTYPYRREGTTQGTREGAQVRVTESEGMRGTRETLDSSSSIIKNPISQDLDRAWTGTTVVCRRPPSHPEAPPAASAAGLTNLTCRLQTVRYLPTRPTQASHPHSPSNTIPTSPRATGATIRTKDGSDDRSRANADDGRS